MSWKVGSSDTVQKTEHKKYVEDALKNHFGYTTDLAKKLWDDGGMPIVDQSDLTVTAGKTALDLAKNPSTNHAQSILDAGGTTYTPKTVDGAEVVESMNPFLSRVGRETINTMRREHDNRDAQIGARHASAVAFGGSGGDIERALSNRHYNQNVGSAVSEILSGGYDRAQDLELSNAQMENEAARFNASQQLSSAIAANGAENDFFNRKATGLSHLTTHGAIADTHAQNIANKKLSLLDWYGGKLPGPSTTTTNSKPLYVNPLSILAGAIM